MNIFRSLAALVLVATTAAQAQYAEFQDYCEADPLARRVADATAMIVPRSELVKDLVRGGYTLTTHPNTWSAGPTGPIALCSDDPFYNQVRLSQGRTGFLVGEQAIVTAPHTLTPVDPDDPNTQHMFHPANFAVVFGWRWQLEPRSGTSPDRDCTLKPGAQKIPDANVYFFDAAGPVPLHNTHSDTAIPDSDYLVFSLDRPVTGITPLPLRRSGAPLPGDPLIAPGHPDMLPLKIGRGGRVQRYGELGVSIGDLPYRGGVSGSPVFNLRAEVVETAIAKGNGSLPFVYDAMQQCYRVVYEKERTGTRSSGTNNGPLEALLPYAPRPDEELVVTPLSLVTHRGSDDNVSNAESSFEVSLSAGAANAVDYRVSVTSGLPAPHPGSSKPIRLMLDPAVGTYTAQPGGAPRRFSVTAINKGVSCEVVDAEVRIQPQTAGAFASVIPHRFEIVRGDFEVTPDTGWNVVALNAPYPTRALTLRNPSTVPVTLVLQPSANWLRVNNAANATVVLTPAGTSGDRATAALSIITNPDSAVPPGTTADATIAITPSSPQCMDRSGDEIAVSFTNGVQEFLIEDVASTTIPHSPDGVAYGAAKDYSVDLSAFAGKLFADIDLSLNFVNGGSPLAGTADELLKIVLISPNRPPGNTGRVLWDSNNAPASYITHIAVDQDLLTLDAPSMPPLGGALFSDFYGEDIGGTWTVRLHSKRQGDIYVPLLLLRLTRQ